MVALARKAVEITALVLPTYSSRFSRKDYTQHQLFSLSGYPPDARLSRGREALLKRILALPGHK